MGQGPKKSWKLLFPSRLLGAVPIPDYSPMRANERRAFQSEAMGLWVLAWRMEQGARSLSEAFTDLLLALCALPFSAHLSIDTVSSFSYDQE